ncbi:sensor domain-containing diguanylate cyclase [Deinococcus malanensis]|uniref:sensor domain-containing diguanylate cyclase n=1 Tax=Deinococcus malanensis TaxID=1706855 RepID=UPI003624C5EF
MATSVRASEPHSLFAVPEAQAFVIRVATGRYEGSDWAALTELEQLTVLAAGNTGRAMHAPYVALPLRVGERRIGVLLVDPGPQSGVQFDLTLLEVFASQAAVAIENVRLFELATTDDLTGLMNRRAWVSRLGEALHLGARYGHPTSVMMIDVDHFKRVNDTYGHLMGDAVLRLLGETLRRDVRTTDVAARYGGEELAVLLPHTSADGAMIFAERVRQSIAQQELIGPLGTLRITASLGVATDPGHTVHRAGEAADLIHRADQALYQAKAGGRDRVVMEAYTAG